MLMMCADEANARVLGMLDEQVAAQTALGKIASAEDIAGAVSFLASQDAKAITGQCVHPPHHFQLLMFTQTVQINVDGGRLFD